MTKGCSLGKEVQNWLDQKHGLWVLKLLASMGTKLWRFKIKKKYVPVELDSQEREAEIQG